MRGGAPGRATERLWRSATLGALVTCARASVALGAPPPATARFVYVPGPGADACASGVALQVAVVARMGRDPFRADAERTVTVSLRRNGAELVGRIELTDRGGKLLGVEEIQSRATNCAELAEALEITLSMLLEARVPTARVASQSPSLSAEAAAPPGPADRRAKIGVSLGALVAFATAPSTVAGASLEVEARWPSYSFGLEGRVDATSTLPQGAGHLQTSLWMITLVPCLRYGWLGVCGLFAAGEQQATAVDIPGGEADSSLYLAPGARLALRVPLGSVFALQARTDVLIPVAKTNIDVGPAQAWVMPPVSFVAGLALEAQISR